MESEVSYSLDNEQQFWDGMFATPAIGPPLNATTELDDIVSKNCDAHEDIDNTLRSFLSFTTKFKGIWSTKTVLLCLR